ncbi:aspartate aminotransferase family protein [Oceanibacterium hippocampi]|uniref:Acetylornithine aminotransferase n=1 Tax=Oceanibacterium hippocampi TaxID=745714 RepID=A0A1Y5RUP6_9PROT|nr:aspartate aminotransferase family protein [Oceanibacterium hippocampi]SLN25493.1 Succinylornithine transaminase/acetylornithine aminotransferase [Oceanibacterium hippocampi]
MESAVLPTYARAPLSFERGEGAYLFDEDGRRYLDFGAGIAVCALGHAHPHLVAALTEQGSKLWHNSNVFQIPGQEKLARRLTERCALDAAFFTNSGVEALECAFKIARRYQYEQGRPERYRILTFDGAFHGRTLAGIAAGGQDKLLKGFGPKVDGFDQSPFGDLAAAKAAIGPETAAILVEPIQGEGGIRVADPAFLKGLRALCDEHDLLLMYDEVQCGMGRTGKLFAHEWSGAAPDVMALAKGIGGGFPLGACLAVEKAAKVMTPGTHGTTYGGNPLAMAVGNAVLDVMLADGFLETVERRANHLRQQLSGLVDRHPTILEELRGQGLMLGLKCRVPNGDLVTALREHGMLAIPGGDNVVRLIPPLIINESHIAEALETLDEACRELEG